MTKFLGLIIDDTLSLKQHIDQVVGCALLAVLYEIENPKYRKIHYE